MSDISFGPRFPASAASDGGNIDLTGDHSREPDYDYVQRGTVESLRARIASLEAENARLRAAGETVAIGLRIALDVPNEPDWAHSAFGALVAWSAALAGREGEG